jgi:hypothetical protein
MKMQDLLQYYFVENQTFKKKNRMKLLYSFSLLNQTHPYLS